MNAPYISQDSPEKQNQKNLYIYIYIYIYKFFYICILYILYIYICVCVYSIEIHFKGLAETIVGVGKPEILRAGQQAGNSGNS